MELTTTDIYLDNNYILKIFNSDTINAVNINNYNKNKLKNKKNLIINIDFNKISERDYKKLIQNLFKLKKFCKTHNIPIGEKLENKKILLGYVNNYNPNNFKEKEFICAINAIFYKTKKERYYYIYDTICEYLDNCFYGKNVCDFVNNKCGEKRNTSSTWGCCRHYKSKLFGPLTKWVLCEHLGKDGRCKIKSIGCKLYTCDYLHSKGIKFKIKDILLLDAFFNPIQKYIIKFSVYTPEEKVIKKLLFF